MNFPVTRLRRLRRTEAIRNLVRETRLTPDAFVYDMQLFFTADGRELLLAAAGTELVLVDGYTGVAHRYAQSTWVDSIAAYDAAAAGSAVELAPYLGSAAPAGEHRQREGNAHRRLSPSNGLVATHASSARIEVVIPIIVPSCRRDCSVATII